MAVQPIKIPITAIDRTKKAFQSVTRGLNVVKKALFNFKVGIAAAVGAAGLGLLVKQSLESIDALGKTASKLGIATAELQKLRFASQLAGVETRTVDMAVQRFTRRLAEAANGTGEAKDALKELGIDAASLSRQPLEKQMLALAAAFEKVEGSGDRVRLAFKLFDSEGVAFVNTLQAGEKALKSTFDEVDDLGIILSKNAVKGVESFNDSVVKLTTIFRGLINTVAAGLAGPLQVLVEMLTGKLKNALGEGGENVRNFTRELGHGIINAVEMALTGFVHFINETGRLIDGLREKIHQVQRFLGSDTSPEEYAARVGKIESALEGLAERTAASPKFKGFFDSVRDELSELISGNVLAADEIDRLKTRLAELASESNVPSALIAGLTAQLGDLRNKSENLGPGFEKLFSEISFGTEVFDRMREGLDRNTDAIEETGEAAQKVGKDLKPLIDAAIEARKMLAAKTDILLSIPPAADKARLSLSQMTDILLSMEPQVKKATLSLAQQTDILLSMDPVLEKVEKNIDKMAMTMRDAKLRGINALEDGLVSLMTGAKSTSEAFRDMAKSILADLARIAIQQTITLPLAQAMGFNVSGARAMGGPVTSGKPYLVGERGPEIVVPGRNSAVIPNDQISGGGVTVNQTINLTTGVSQTVRAEVLNMLPQIAEAAKGAVLDAKRRGGSYAAAMG